MDLEVVNLTRQPLRKLGIACVVTAFGVVAVITFNRVIFSGWERMLAGPFAGTNYVGEVSGTLVSSLELPKGHTLQVYQLNGSADPVLCLRSASGSNVWCQVLVPELIASDGSTRRGKIDSINLKWSRRSDLGFKIYVLCDWYWGGKEAGLIYLGRDLSFQSFSLSW